MVRTPVTGNGTHPLPYSRSRLRVQEHSVAGMSIGRLAQAAGVHVETVRYYQRVGLLPTPVKNFGVQRRYGYAALQQIGFIKRAQGLGFSLEEIRDLQGLMEPGHCSETRQIALKKLAVVERKLADLIAIQNTLRELIRACESGEQVYGCPIIRRLSPEREAADEGNRAGLNGAPGAPIE